MSKSTLLAAGNTPTQEEEPVSFPGRSSLVVHTLTHLGETQRPRLSARGLAGTGGIRRETPASCFAK